MSTTNQSWGFLGSLLSELVGPLMKVAIPLGKNLLKGVTKTVKNETKRQKGGFLSMLLGTSLLGNILAVKGIVRAGSGIKK